MYTRNNETKKVYIVIPDPALPIRETGKENRGTASILRENGFLKDEYAILGNSSPKGHF